MITKILGNPCFELLFHKSRDSCSLLTGMSGKRLTAPLRSMGSTLRTKSNPLGRQDSQAVLDGNILCARALLLMLICSAKGIFWCLEQPSSSTMEWRPLFQMLLRLVTVRKLTFRMSQFGGTTPKRTIIYSRISPRFSKGKFQI